MQLADTSVWVDYSNGVATPRTDLLRRWHEEQSVVMADLVLTEVLQGLRDQSRVAALLLSLIGLPQVQIGGEAIAIATAANYRALRRQGITIRSTIDCLIATYCIENDVELLHSDRDFDPFEEHLGLRVIRP